MDEEISDQVVQALRERGGLDEVWEVLGTFRAYRAGRLWTIEVVYARSGVPTEYRWNLRISSDDGKRVRGNGGNTLRDAMSSIHWQEFEAVELSDANPQPGPA